MGNFIHIGEVAVLLLLAYTLGWVVGYFARRVAQPRLQPVDLALQNLAIARTVSAGASPTELPSVEPMTAAPILPVTVTAEPLNSDLAPVSALDALKSLSEPMPLRPVEVPPIAAAASPIVGSTSDPAPPLPEQVAGPAAAPEAIVPPSDPDGAGAALLSGPEQSQPRSPASTNAVPTEVPATVVDTPVASKESSEPIPVAIPPMPASQPGIAWSGNINGHEARRFDAEIDPLAATDEAPMTPGPTLVPAAEPAKPEVAVEATDPALDVALLASMAEELMRIPGAGQPDPDPAADPAVTEPEIVSDDRVAPPLPEAPPVPDVPAVDLSAPPPPPAVAPPTTPVTPPAPPAAAVTDEDAAMRAIEGGWSRRAARALPDAPELTDVTAAVTAAQVAVEQVLARNGVEVAEGDDRPFGKPRGLPRPREGLRDDLKQIKGLGPLDESTLNNLGIYHFDQIAGWDQKEVLWMENHAFARGRVARETWQAQARELADMPPAARASR